MKALTLAIWIELPALVNLLGVWSMSSKVSVEKFG